MAKRQLHTIECDRDECDARVSSAYNLTSARATGRRLGWQISYHPDWDGGFDFCPRHKDLEALHGNHSADGVRTAL